MLRTMGSLANQANTERMDFMVTTQENNKTYVLSNIRWERTGKTGRKTQNVRFSYVFDNRDGVMSADDVVDVISTTSNR